MLKIIECVVLGGLILVSGVQIGYRFFGRYSWRVYHEHGPWYAWLLLFPVTFYFVRLLKFDLPAPIVVHFKAEGQPLDSPNNLKEREEYSFYNALLWVPRLGMNLLLIVLVPLIGLIFSLVFVLTLGLVELTVFRLDHLLNARSPQSPAEKT